MKINSYEVADFFKQLSLLTRSSLPLPMTLHQLAKDYRGRNMRTLIDSLGNDADSGMTLSEALAKHPDSFHPLYVRMIALGEKEGSLPEILSELAQISRLQYMLANMVRDIMLYPLITISVAFIIMIFVGAEVIPHFKVIFDELLAGEPLPGLTNMIIGFSNIIKNYLPFCIGLYIAYVIAIIWLFTDKKYANTVLVFLIRKMPFSEVVFYNFAMSRFCKTWAILMRRKVPVDEAFPIIADMMDFPELSLALNRIAARCREGQDLISCLKCENNISNLLLMTLESGSERQMPEELDKLAELFKERAYYGYRRTGMAWEMISVIGMVVVVAGVIFMLFLPFICRIFAGW